MKKLLFCLFCLFILNSFPLHAQENKNVWVVFDTKKSEEHTINIIVPDTSSIQEETVSPSNLETAIVGADDRQNISGKASIYEQAVVLVQSSLGQCSGAMVGPRTVLTAAHCLVSKGDFVSDVWVHAPGVPKDWNQDFAAYRGENEPKNNFKRYYYRQDIDRENLEKTIREQIDKSASKKIGYPAASADLLFVPDGFLEISRNSKNEQYISIANERYDYAIISLKEELGNKTGWLGLKAKTIFGLLGRKIVLAGRSYDKSPENTLWKSTGRIGFLIPPVFKHNADMLSGNSGGPIFLADDPKYIIGLSNFDNGEEHADRGFPNGALRIGIDIIEAVNSIEQQVYK